MKQEKKDIIAKIAKILIQAKDQEGTPEGETFRRHAGILMAKYRIQETEVDLEASDFILDKFQFLKDGGNVPQWVGQTIGIFCRTFDCQSIRRNTHKGWEISGMEWDVIGTFSDVETTMYFVEVVCHHIEKEAWKTWPKKENHSKREQLGNVAAEIIYDRAGELKTQMDQTIHESEGCSALVVQKEREVSDAIREHFPNLSYARGTRTNLPSDSKTRDAGRNAGQTAPLNFAIAG